MASQMNKEEIAQQDWDVVIVGGGMVGATTALGLAQQHFKVLLVERSLPNTDWDETTPYEMRVSALTRATENILKAIGAWKGIASRRFHPFTDMHVWDDATDGKVHFSAADLNEANLGYVVENSIVQAALWDQIENEFNITCLIGETITELQLTKKGATLSFDGGVDVNARLIVGADGAQSQIRQFANIELDTHDYGQCAIVGCVKTQKSHQNTCWQRYASQGPFAYLSMPDNVSSIAWYLPVDKKEWALSLNDAEFASQVTAASGGMLGEVIEVGQRGGFPLVRNHAKHYVKSHLVLVGDAAHTIHPQAGQGVNLGFLDAAALIDVLVEARESSPEKDWSRLMVLRRYERWRRGDNAIVQRSMEGFDWLFKQDVAFKTHFRRAFLPIANKMTPVKNWMMSNALHGREAAPSLTKNK